MVAYIFVQQAVVFDPVVRIKLMAVNCRPKNNPSEERG